MQGKSIVVVPGSRRGRHQMIMVAPPPKGMFYRTPLPTGPDQHRKWFRARAYDRARVKIAVRAVRYRRGGMFLAALRWHEARDRADLREHEIQAAALAALRLLAACGEPADDLSATAADLRAHAILTAAPPASRAPVLAGAAA
jgi:hypothetical protein